jgi:hypothetical protein
MDLEELLKKTPEDLLKLLRELKLKPDGDKELLRNIKLAYCEKISTFKVVTGHSDVGLSYIK